MYMHLGSGNPWVGDWGAAFHEIISVQFMGETNLWSMPEGFNTFVGIIECGN